MSKRSAESKGGFPPARTVLASLRNSHAEEPPFDDDDGHTVADMSVLDGSPSAPGAVPGSKRDVREELGDPDDRRALVFGATWAGLSIGLVYIVVFGIVIAFLLWLWRA